MTICNYEFPQNIEKLKRKVPTRHILKQQKTTTHGATCG